MDIEGRIRTRIEAILVNDAKNYAELKSMATDGDPFDEDPFAEERNLHQRIINSYRSAVSEVNGLLEENIGYLSGFYRVIETIKDKVDFQEICSLIVDCVLQDLAAEYCGIILTDHPESLHLEGTREERKIICIHSRASLLGSTEFEQAVFRLASDSGEYLNIPDVYREPGFDSVDFPSVVRSLVCLPIEVRGAPAGIMVLSHSLARFFTDNHIRVLRILSSIIAHLKLITGGKERSSPRWVAPVPENQAEREVLSVVLFAFETSGANGSNLDLDRETVQSIRRMLSRSLRTEESILLYDDNQLVLLSPGVTSERLPERVRYLQGAFHKWKKSRNDRMKNTRLSLGFATCEEGEDLARILQIASLMTRPDG